MRKRRRASGMAYREVVREAKRIAQLHVPGITTVERIYKVMINFQVIYNSFLWDPQDRYFFSHAWVDKNRPNLPASLVRLVGKAAPQDLVADFANAQPLKSNVLQVDSIEPSTSVNVNLSGLGEVIDAAAEVCDPLRRRQRKERVRHAELRNRQAERPAELDAGLKSLELIERTIELLDRLVTNQAIPAEDSQRAIMNLVSVQDAAARALEEDRVEVTTKAIVRPTLKFPPLNL